MALYEDLVRLAFSHPSLRDDLLPIVCSYRADKPRFPVGTLVRSNFRHQWYGIVRKHVIKGSLEDGSPNWIATVWITHDPRGNRVEGRPQRVHIAEHYLKPQKSLPS